MPLPDICIGDPIQRIARKRHACSVCAHEITPGNLYVQDGYWAPYGNGRRYCCACAKACEDAWDEWRRRPIPELRARGEEV